MEKINVQTLGERKPMVKHQTPQRIGQENVSNRSRFMASYQQHTVKRFYLLSLNMVTEEEHFDLLKIDILIA